MKKLAKGILLLVILILTGSRAYAEYGYASVTICTGDAEPVCELYRVDPEGKREKVQELHAREGKVTLLLEYGEYEIPPVLVKQQDGMYETLPMHFYIDRNTEDITMYLKYEKTTAAGPPEPETPKTGDEGILRWIILLAACSFIAGTGLFVRVRRQKQG